MNPILCHPSIISLPNICRDSLVQHRPTAFTYLCASRISNTSFLSKNSSPPLLLSLFLSADFCVNPPESKGLLSPQIGLPTVSLHCQENPCLSFLDGPLDCKIYCSCFGLLLFYSRALFSSLLEEMAIENEQNIGFVRAKQKKVMVDRMVDEDSGPPWLVPLLRTSFFVPCEVHFDSSKNECNMYCLDCTESAMCSYCLTHHRDHHVVQIRRSSYHDVIRVSEVSKFIDVSWVQTYVINSHKIVFLNGRPQPRHGKGVTNTCEICGRTILDCFRFCSLGCKLGGMKRDPGLSFALYPKHLHGSESDESWVPKKLRKTSAFDFAAGVVQCSDGNGGDSNNSISPAIATITSYRTSRRKGVPRRAPF